MASSQSFSISQRRMLLSPWPGVAGEERAAVVHLGDAAAQRRAVVHLRRHVGQEEHLAIAGTGHQRELLALVHHLEARVAHPVLAAHGFEVFLPALAVGRVGEHEVELLRREGIVRQRGPLRAADDVVRILALALEQHVRLADGVGLRVDLLAVELALHLLSVLRGERGERLFRHGEHAARAAGAVVEQVGAGLDRASRWAGRPGSPSAAPRPVASSVRRPPRCSPR